MKYLLTHIFGLFHKLMRWSRKIGFLTLFVALLCFPIMGEETDRSKRIFRLFLEIEDGDTVVYMGNHMRFLGVDTPELRNPEVGFYLDQPYGRVAKQFTRRTLREANRVSYLENGYDRYGRLLVHLFVDDYPLSVRIIEAGLGYETVSVYGDNGFPQIAEMIMNAAKLHPVLPFENPYLWRKKNRRQ